MYLNSKQASHLDRHVALLCAQMGVRRGITRGRGEAKVRLRTIKHQPIVDNEMAYFVALHELGHVAIGMKQPRLDREAAAWIWALENSAIYPHYATRQRICALLVRYLYRAKENGWEFPNEDSDYWKLFRWWEVEDGT